MILALDNSWYRSTETYRTKKPVLIIVDTHENYREGLFVPVSVSMS